MDSRVIATINLYAARATLKAAELEVAERQIPLTRGTSNARLSASKRLKEARRLAEGWALLVTLAELEQRADDRACPDCGPGHGRHSDRKKCMVMTSKGQTDGRARACGCTS